MSIDLSIQSSKQNNIDYLELHGELDDFHAPKLTDAVNALDNPKKLIINLDHTTFIDSVGLGSIAKIGKSIQDINGQLQLICNKPQLIRLLSASGLIAALHSNIGMAESIESATANLNAL